MKRLRESFVFNKGTFIINLYITEQDKLNILLYYFKLTLDSGMHILIDIVKYI